MDKSIGHNRRLAKKWVQCLNETLYLVSKSVLAYNLVLRNPLLPQPQKRKFSLPRQKGLLMTWIDDIRKVYAEYFKDTFDKLGLKKYEEMDGPGTGALIKFKNDSFRLQIINDRGLLEMNISPLHGDEQFRGIEMFNSFLQLGTNKKLSELERKIIIGTRLDYAGQVNFLLDNAEQLKDLLDKKNYKDALKRIDALGQERFRFQFKGREGNGR